MIAFVQFLPKITLFLIKKWQKLPLWAAQKSQKLIERRRYIGADSVCSNFLISGNDTFTERPFICEVEYSLWMLMTFNVFNLGCIHTQRPFLRQVQGLSPLYQGLNVHMCGLGGQSKGRNEGRQSFSFFFLLFFLSWSLISGSSYRYIRCMV